MSGLEKALEAVSLYIGQWMPRVNMPGLALAVTDRERLLAEASFGFANLDSGAPIQGDTMFEIGSIGKSFTSIALLQLHQEGALDLHAPVADYLPWFQVKSGYGAITAHHLMTHTSGLPAGTDIGTHGLYEAWALRGLSTAAPPGEHFRYSNVGYKILGFLLEELDGRSYQESIQKRVLDPLGMEDSHAVISYDTRRRAAVGYRSFYDDRPFRASHGLVPAMWTEYGVGDGCQASTAGDMAAYLRILMNRGAGPSGRLLSEDAFRLMTQRAIATGQWGGAHYGYGLTLADIDGHAYLGHGGSTTGFMSAMIADMDDGIGVALLINGYAPAYGAVDMALHILKCLRAGMRQEELPSPPSATESEGSASGLAGVFRSGEERLAIVAEEGGLTLRWRGKEAPLQRYGADSFYVSHPDLEHYLLEAKRCGGEVAEIFHGPDWYVGENYSGPDGFDYPEEWEAFPGHYRTYNFGLTNFRVVIRKGELLLIYPSGDHEPLIPLANGLFRVGEDPRSPETLRFDSAASSRALRAVYSGCPYYRTFTP